MSLSYSPVISNTYLGNLLSLSTNPIICPNLVKYLLTGDNMFKCSGVVERIFGD